MHKPINLSGRRFGRLTVIAPAPRISKRTAWACRCDCGAEMATSTDNLMRKKARSCGCLQRELTAARFKTHGLSGQHVLGAWSSMKARCNNPRNPAYKNYGGRGITVCSRWNASLEDFHKDMGERPSPAHSIDRIDNDGDYTPENCRWATATEQANNSRNVLHIEFEGCVLGIAAWARKTGIKRGTIQYRLKAGWSVERALTAPVRYH